MTRGAVLLSTVAVVLATAAAARAAGPLPPVDLSAGAPDGGAGCAPLSVQPGVGGVDVAANARGDTIVAWTRNAGGGRQMVQAAFRPAGGSFGQPQDLGLTEPCYALGFVGSTPDVALDAAGGAVIVFAALDERGGTAARAAIKPPNGPFGIAVDLATDVIANQGDGPRVAMNEAGTAVAVWSRLSGSDTIVQASTRLPGGPFAPAVRLSDTGADAREARVAVNAAGAAAAAWLRNDGTIERAQARVRPAGVTAFAPVRTASPAGTASQAAKELSLAIAPDGRSTVAWTRFENGNDVVQARDLDAAGSLDELQEQISDPADESAFPDLAIDASGTTVVAWQACPSGDCDVEAAVRPPGGGFGAPEPVAVDASTNVRPKVAVDRAGVATVALAPGLAPAPVVIARRPAAGRFGPTQAISSPDGTSLRPSLATDDQGNVLVGWAFRSSAGAQLWTAQASVFDAAAPTLDDVNTPGASTVGQPVSLSASATDRWSPVSLAWSPGDGTTFAGGAVSHAFGAPGRFAATVTATDGAGNAASATRSIAVTAAPTPKKKVIRSKVRATWAVEGRRIFLLRLRATRVPKGGKVALRCRRSERCPFDRKSSKRRRRGGITLFKELEPKQAARERRRRFRAGQRLEVRVTAKGFVGKAVRYDLKKGRIPSGRSLCLPEGAKRPRARC